MAKTAREMVAEHWMNKQMIQCVVREPDTPPCQDYLTGREFAEQQALLDEVWEYGFDGNALKWMKITTETISYNCEVFI